MADAVATSDRRWLCARYSPVSLFSLRMTHATSKGGKTLLTPTPYAVKMALLDVCFHLWDRAEAPVLARRVFDWIKGREVRVLPPPDCVVQQTFVKVLDLARDKSEGPFRPTIAYREFAWYRGPLEVALASDGFDEEAVTILSRLFPLVNSLGKRGGFLQFVDLQVHEGDLPPGFTRERAALEPTFAEHYLTTQALDDFGEALCRAKDGFDRISTYGPGVMKLGHHRILRLTALPYRRRSADRRHTWYRRTDQPDSAIGGNHERKD